MEGMDVSFKCMIAVELRDAIQKDGFFHLYKNGSIVDSQPVPKGLPAVTFSIQKVNRSDTGNYTCVYGKEKIANSANNKRSRPVYLDVTESYGLGNDIRIFLSLGILLVLSGIVGEDFYSRQRKHHGEDVRSGTGDKPGGHTLQRNGHRRGGVGRRLNHRGSHPDQSPAQHETSKPGSLACSPSFDSPPDAYKDKGCLTGVDVRSGTGDKPGGHTLQRNGHRRGGVGRRLNHRGSHPDQSPAQHETSKPGSLACSPSFDSPPDAYKDKGCLTGVDVRSGTGDKPGGHTLQRNGHRRGGVGRRLNHRGSHPDQSPAQHETSKPGSLACSPSFDSPPDAYKDKGCLTGVDVRSGTGDKPGGHTLQRNGHRRGGVGRRLNHRGSHPDQSPAQHETSKPGSLACSPSFDSPPDAYKDKGCLTGVDVRSGTGDKPGGHTLQRNGHRRGGVGRRLNHRGSHPDQSPAQHETSKPGSLACSPSFDSPPDAYKDKGCLTGVDVRSGTGDKPGGHTLQRNGHRRGGVGRRLNHRGSHPDQSPAQHETSKPGSLACSPSFDSPPDAYKDKGCLTGVDVRSGTGDKPGGHTLQRNGHRRGGVGRRLNHRGSHPDQSPAQHETSKPGSLACSPSFDSPPDAYKDKGCLTGVDVRSGTGDKPGGHTLQRNGHRRGGVGRRLNHRGSHPDQSPAQHETSKPGSLACSPSFDSPPDAYKDKGCLTGVDVRSGTGDKPGGHTLQRNGHRRGGVGRRLNHRGSHPDQSPAQHETSKPGSLACSPSFDSPPDAYKDKGCLTGVDVRSGTGDKPGGHTLQRNGHRRGGVGRRLNHRGSHPDQSPAQHETSKPGSLACSPSFDSPPDAYKDKGCLTGVDVRSGTGDKPGGHTLQRNGHRRGGVGRRLNHRGSHPDQSPAQHETSKPGSLACSPSFDSPPDAYKDKGCLTGVDVRSGTGDKPGGHTLQRNGHRRGGVGRRLNHRGSHPDQSPAQHETSKPGSLACSPSFDSPPDAYKDKGCLTGVDVRSGTGDKPGGHTLQRNGHRRGGVGRRLNHRGSHPDQSPAQHETSKPGSLACSPSFDSPPDAYKDKGCLTGVDVRSGTGDKPGGHTLQRNGHRRGGVGRRLNHRGSHPDQSPAQHETSKPGSLACSPSFDSPPDAYKDKGCLTGVDVRSGTGDKPGGHTLQRNGHRRGGVGRRLNHRGSHPDQSPAQHETSKPGSLACSPSFDSPPDAYKDKGCLTGVDVRSGTGDKPGGHTLQRNGHRRGGVGRRLNHRGSHPDQSPAQHETSKPGSLACSPSFDSPPDAYKDKGCLTGVDVRSGTGDKPGGHTLQRNGHRRGGVGRRLNHRGSHPDQSPAQHETSKPGSLACSPSFDSPPDAYKDKGCLTGVDVRSGTGDKPGGHTLQRNGHRRGGVGRRLNHRGSHPDQSPAQHETSKPGSLACSPSFDSPPDAYKDKGCLTGVDVRSGTGDKPGGHTLQRNGHRRGGVGRRLNHRGSHPDQSPAQHETSKPGSLACSPSFDSPPDAYKDKGCLTGVDVRSGTGDKPGGHTLQRNGHRRGGVGRRLNHRGSHPDQSPAQHETSKPGSLACSPSFDSPPDAYKDKGCLTGVDVRSGTGNKPGGHPLTEERTQTRRDVRSGTGDKPGGHTLQRNGHRRGGVGRRLNHRGSHPDQSPAQHETSKPGSLACSPSFDSPPDAYKDKGCLTGVDVRSGTGDKPGGHTLQRNGHRRGGVGRRLNHRGSHPDQSPAQHETSKPGSLACSPSFDSPPDAYSDKGCLTGVDVRSGTGDKPGGHTLQRNGHRRGGVGRRLNHRGSHPDQSPAQHETSKPGSLACSPSFDSPPDAYNDKGCLTGVDVRSGTGDKPGGHTLQRDGRRRARGSTNHRGNPFKLSSPPARCPQWGTDINRREKREI
ncbi:UNVERIFIED_CONTAM: hypothetical protein FKN15_035469 [Acipenser sinensis]